MMYEQTKMALNGQEKVRQILLKTELIHGIIDFSYKKGTPIFTEIGDAKEFFDSEIYKQAVGSKADIYNSIVCRLNSNDMHPMDSCPDEKLAKNTFPTCDICGFSPLIWGWSMYKSGTVHLNGICPFCGRNYSARNSKRHCSFWYMAKVQKGNRCAICGSDKDIQVHHIIPVWSCKKIGRDDLINDPHNAIVLCTQCHNAVHGKT